MQKWIKENWQILGIWLIFECVAVSLTYFTKNWFYLYNFTYIGSCLALGIYMFSKNMKYGRRIVQFCVGMYMLVYLGIMSRENMQIEGFWYYLFLGVFEAATIHYAVAKIFGPIFFGRGWCGYACWTGAILDVLPYEVPKGPRKKKLGIIRYIVFLTSLIFVASLFYFKVKNLEQIMFIAFIVGNVVYYLLGIVLAFALKDNRAFCKYICPVTVFLKIASYFSILRVKCDKEKCIDCNKCINNCPMNVNMKDNSYSRENGTECILCGKCVNLCPNKALKM